MANRAKSLEDVREAGEMNSISGAVARLPAERREQVIRIQKAFLDFRRLLLKTQLTEAHMKELLADAELLPQIHRLDDERLDHQEALMSLEEQMRDCEDAYYSCGAELSTSFLRMLSFLKVHLFVVHSS